MRALAALFRRCPPGPPSPAAPGGDSLLGACQAGNFGAAQSLLGTLPAEGPARQAELDRSLGVLLSHAHVRGLEWGHSELDRWALIRRLRTVGASVPQAVAAMPGCLRRLSSAQWNTLVDWGAPLEPLHAWKMWGAWVDDPILSDSPPPEGEPRMGFAEALSTVRDMVARGLRADVVDAEGRTPLHVLCVTARLRTAERIAPFLAWFDLLVSAHAPLDGCDADGNTVLHALCETRSATLVPERLLTRVLHAHPALIAIRNRFGQLPIDVLRVTHRQQRRAGPAAPWLQRARWLQDHEEHHRLMATLPPAPGDFPPLRRL